MKRASEGKLRQALGQMDLQSMIYKPPDDARNRKPADFIVWIRGLMGATSVFVEAKDTPRVDRWPLADLTPSQRQGIRRAHELGIPYWLAIYWRGRQRWSISDAWRVLETDQTSLSWGVLTSTLGIESEPHLLPSVLRAVLTGEVFSV